MSDGGVIRWEDPPPVPVGRPSPGPWALIAHQLRGRPGEWGLVALEGHTAIAARINNGVSWWAPAGSFQATVRTIDGRMHVWARYVGPPN